MKAKIVNSATLDTVPEFWEVRADQPVPMVVFDREIEKEQMWPMLSPDNQWRLQNRYRHINIPNDSEILPRLAACTDPSASKGQSSDALSDALADLRVRNGHDAVVFAVRCDNDTARAHAALVKMREIVADQSIEYAYAQAGYDPD
jgi:hypothetical protein